ncbi:MAG: PAS domain S-box protein [Bacteroidetes bacterium]|nr:PAS domain S-box protein [Bacteroidota bacterium]
MKREKWEANTSKGLILIFILTTIVLLASGIFYLKNEEAVWSNNALKQLKIATRLKLSQVEGWREERLSAAREIAQSPLLHDAVTHWISQRGKKELQTEIRQSLNLVIKNNPDLVNIFLTDTSGHTLLAANSGKFDMETPAVSKLIRQVAEKDKEIFGDLFKSRLDGAVYADIAWPIHNGKIQAVLLFRMNPRIGLFPILQSWPYDSTTEESFLFEARGDSVLFLSDLKSRPDAALSFKMAMTAKNNPAVLAIQNGPGFYEGVGYHGQRVIEYIQSIAGSSWFLASKIDRDELFQPVHRRVKTLALILSLLFVSLSTFLFLIINYRRKHFFRQLLEDEREQAALKSHYEYVVKYANDIILLEDENLNIIEANQRARQTYQYSLEELLKMKITDLVAPESKTLIENRLKNITENDGAIVESIHQRKDGSLFYVEISARIIKIDGRDFLHQVIRDITERKQAEIALIESEERFRTTLYSTGDAIITTDATGEVRYMNPVAEELTDWKEDEAGGKPIREVFSIFSEDTCEEVESPVDKVLERGMIVLLSDHTFLKSKNGKEIPISDSGAPIRDAEGKITGVVLVFRDESKDRLAQKALEESELHFHSLSDNAPVGIFRTRPDGYTTYVNPKWCLLSGITEEEAMGDGWLTAVHPDDRENLANKWGKACQNKEVSNAEYRFLHTDGTTVYVLGYTVPEINSNSQITGFIGTITDITDSKQMFDDLRAAKEKAEESDRLKSAFLDTMSHELRTPLNAVIGFSSLIDQELPLEQITSFAQIINNSGNNLLEIIEGIFDLALLESGETKLEQKQFDLSVFMDKIFDIAKAEQRNAGKQQIEIVYAKTINAEPVLLYSDPNKLTQVFTNLLKNALKFTHTGKIEFGYMIRPNGNNDKIEFFLKDTGIGIPENQKSIIFDRFRQVDDSHTRLYGGTGIGLAISKKMVELLGGKIRVDSELRKGSTFYFTIPYLPAESTPEPIHLYPATESKEKSFSGKTILVAEDEESNFVLLKYLLIKLDLQILHARDGQEAVELCSAHPEISLVLMDIKMPRLNGLEASIKIKELDPKLPVIAQSAFALQGDIDKAFESGCDGYLVKPVNKEKLFTLLEKFFQ